MSRGLDHVLQRFAAAQQQATQSILRHPRIELSDQLEQLAQRATRYTESDVYGRGPLIEELEQRVAELLGKPAALFFPSGTMAQPLALRIHSDQRQQREVLLHPTSHLLLHEQNGLQELWGLIPTTIGEASQPIRKADLPQSTAASSLVLELPAREIGGQLPSWQDLLAQVQWARAQGVAVHFDGARLWQCPPYYQQSLAAIAELADSVYVSLYKDLGGIAGAILAGSADFIATARIWQRRAGGNLYSYAPFILAAQQGLDDNLQAVEQAYHYTQQLVPKLASIEGLSITPNPPQASMFHVFFPLTQRELIEAVTDYAETTGIVMLSLPRQVTESGCTCEVSVGRAAMQQTPEYWHYHWQQAFGPLLARAKKTKGE